MDCARDIRWIDSEFTEQGRFSAQSISGHSFEHGTRLRVTHKNGTIRQNCTVNVAPIVRPAYAGVQFWRNFCRVSLLIGISPVDVEAGRVSFQPLHSGKYFWSRRGSGGQPESFQAGQVQDVSGHLQQANNEK